MEPEKSGILGNPRESIKLNSEAVTFANGLYALIAGLVL